MTTSRQLAEDAARTVCDLLKVAPPDHCDLVADVINRAISSAAVEADRAASNQARELKARAQERMSRVLGSSPAVLYSFRATGDFEPVYVSDNITRILGYDPADYLDNPGFWRDRVHPDDLGRVEQEVSDLFGNGIHNVEYRFRRADGSYCWVNDEQRVIRDEGGNPVEVVGSWSDISERKQLESEAAAAHERLNNLLSSQPAVIYSFHAHGDYAPTYVSANLRDLFGYECNEYLESPDFWWRCVHEDDHHLVESAISDLEARGRISLEYRFQRKDGSYAWVGDEQRLIRDSNGKPLEVVGSWSDISRRKQAEQAYNEVNQRIAESIQYASRIQTAILPPREALSELTSNHFLIWEPRDVVGGDFFWFHRTDRGYLIILGDCTGHGVPGAFMTLIVCGLLDQIVRASGPGYDPAEILNLLHRRLRNMLGQDRLEGGTDDGLDAGACFVDEQDGRLDFAGAHISLWCAGASNVREIRGDRPGLGYRQYPDRVRFTRHSFELKSGQVFYMTTDGLVDQIGGPRRRSFGKKRLSRFIAENHGLALDDQGTRLRKLHGEYQGDEIRRDDVTVIGFAPSGPARED